MSDSFAVSPYNPYANDNCFWKAFSSYNPQFRGTAQQDSTATNIQVPYAADTTGVSTQTNYTTSPSFGNAEIGSARTGGMSSGTVGTLAAVGVSAATLIYAYRRGNGAGMKQGFINIGKSIKKFVSGDGAKKAADKADDVAAKISNIIKDGGKNLKEYTIKKNGMSFVIKDGKPVKIITQDKKVIDKASEITKWISKNPSVKTEINSLALSGTTLPKGVSLSYTKEIAEGRKNVYRLVVENGKVVKASSKDKAGKWVDVADDHLESFVKNHAKSIKEAETLNKTLYGKKVQILDKKGKLKTQTGNVEMNVRNGEVVSAKFNGKDLKPEELKALQKDHSAEIQRFGNEAGSRYGLTNYEYVYRQKGGQTVRFNDRKYITNVTAVTDKPITNKDAIKSWLEKNDGIRTELDNIATSGAISEGYRIGNMTYKDDSGRIFEIIGNKISGIKLDKRITINGKTFKAGDLIDGKHLGEWRKTAENNNAYESVLELLK